MAFDANVLRLPAEAIGVIVADDGLPTLLDDHAPWFLNQDTVTLTDFAAGTTHIVETLSISGAGGGTKRRCACAAGDPAGGDGGCSADGAIAGLPSGCCGAIGRGGWGPPAPRRPCCCALGGGDGCNCCDGGCT